MFSELLYFPVLRGRNGFFKGVMNHPNPMWVYAGVQRGIRDVLYHSNICDLAALSVVLGFQDSYTRGHARRVAAYARRIAQRMGLPTDYVETVRIGGLLHDIGKIAFSPELISNTQEKLSTAMRAEIQRHPEIGGQFLKAIQVAEPVIDCVRYHHERQDGSGYPYGLKADEIPLGARIISVADCFDALSTDRSYQKRRTIAESIDIIKSLGNENLSAEFVAQLIIDVCDNGLQA
jgi:putative nucleotidyltransferase with HDIG domain